MQLKFLLPHTIGRLKKEALFLGTVLFLSGIAHAGETGFPMSGSGNKPDTVPLIPAETRIPSGSLSSDEDVVSSLPRFIRRIGIDIRPEYIIPSNVFLEGENATGEPIRNAFSAHLKYSFRFHPFTHAGRIYPGAYQGIGLTYYTFNERQQLGNPVALYLFQGARITRFHPRLSLNYEWNFGLSAGWKPYDYETNSYNMAIGSKINAYMNVQFYTNWMLSPQFDLNAGVSLTHFSNGNTRFPNAGLNTAGLNIGLSYHMNRKNDFFSKPAYLPLIPKFPRHVSYDILLFGAWRRKGVILEDEAIASPHVYPVAGFSFAPMYNFGYRFRAGVSLDGVYDGSANIYTEDYIIPFGEANPGYTFYKPSLNKQLALGLSGRAEYVMPFLTVGLGLGANIVHGGGDLKGFYQTLALKIELTRSSFLHIGYSLKDFHDPNFLMLGIGYRFHNQYPCFHR